MKNLLKLGTPLTKEAQKTVIGGRMQSKGYAEYICNSGTHSGSSNSPVSFDEAVSVANSACANHGGVESVWCFGCD